MGAPPGGHVDQLVQRLEVFGCAGTRLFRGRRCVAEQLLEAAELGCDRRFDARRLIG